jgi:hypothetical protein
MIKNRKIIALTTDPYDNIYGYAFVCIKLFDFIQKNNKDIETILISNDGVCSSLVGNKNFIKIKLNPKSHLLSKAALLVYSFIKEIWLCDANTTLVANGELPELLSICLLRVKFKNTYCFVHDDYEPKFRKYGYLYNVIRRFLLARIKNIIVINSSYAIDIKKHIKNANCYIVPDPILIERAAASLSDTQKIGKNMHIFMVGLPTIEKGIDDYYYLASNMPEDKFYWFCNRIDKEVFEKYNDRIIFRIGLEREKMFSDIKKMDIFCSCSYYESFCLPIGEAIIMDKPVIVYLAKEVKSVYDSFIQYVEYRDRNAMLEALREFKAGNYLGNRKKAKHLIEENYTLEIISKKLLSVLLS